MKLYIKQEKFVCKREKCRKSVTIRSDSFFADLRLPCSTIMLVAYHWLGKSPVYLAMAASGCSSHTVCDLYFRFRHLVSNSVKPEDAVIGGDNIVVEIDESKFGKRKYNRGHRVEGVWVVGGVEKTAEKRIFVVPVEDRTKVTLLGLIRKHVKPGSIIHTDLWKGYSGLSEDGQFQHFTVNHSKHFKDPVTGVHTNTIEGTWNGIKTMIKPRNRVAEGMDDHLWECAWRRQNKNKLWKAFILALRDVFFE
jgi:transposase-like protein